MCWHSDGAPVTLNVHCLALIGILRPSLSYGTMGQWDSFIGVEHIQAPFDQHGFFLVALLRPVNEATDFGFLDGSVP